MHSTAKRQIEPAMNLAPNTLAGCQHWVNQRLGLHFPPKSWPDLNRHLALLAGELGYRDARELAWDLLSQPHSGRLESQLADALTVGETYFFRDPSCFEHLAHQVLKPLIDRRRSEGSKRITLWSAGCSSGEEAYSLAMLMDELLDDVDSWQIRILGTDISRQSLNKAREAVYGAWSFRSVASNITSRYVQPDMPDAAGDGSGNARLWRIRREIRSQVRFFELNLAKPIYPDETRGLADVDVIMCRNVLMYFSPAQAIVVLRRLVRCLADEGILLVGAVDGSYCQSAGLKTQSWPGALAISAGSLEQSYSSPPYDQLTPLAEPLIAHRSKLKEPSPSADDITELSESSLMAQCSSVPSENSACTQGRRHRGLDSDNSASAPLWENARQAMAEGRYREALPMAERAVSQGGLTPRQEAERATLCARILANLKKLAEAEYWARQAIQLDSLQASGYWILATILVERNQYAKARDELAKALYLQPDFILAQYLSGLIAKQLRDPDLARRDLRNCLEMLADLAGDDPVPEGDGLCAAELRQLAITVLADLGCKESDRYEGFTL